MYRKALVRLGIIASITGVAFFLLLGMLETGAASIRGEVNLPLDTVGWTNLGLNGAGITDGVIAIDGTNDIVYACTTGVYGIYRTTDGGQSWAPITNTLGSCVRAYYHPINDSLYWHSGYSELRVSGDGGLTWQVLLSPTEDAAPSDFTVDPITPTKIYVSQNYHGRGGIVRSTDGGISWQQAWLAPDGSTLTDTIDATAIEIAVDPTNSDYVFASVGSFQPWSDDKGFYRSTDGGQTFYRIVTDTVGVEAGVGVNANGTVFASHGGSVWRSYTHGDSWENICPDCGSLHFSFHPVLTRTVWIWGRRSDDEGSTWTTYDEYVDAPAVHPVTTETLYSSNTYGAIKSIDDGTTWTDINNGLEEISVSRIAVDPHDRRRYFVVATGGIGYTEDDGQNWTFPVLAEDFQDVVIDPSDPDVIYVTGWGFPAVFKSVNGGATWTSTEIWDDLSLGVRLNHLVLDPDNSQTGYIAIDTNGPPDAGHWGGIYKTTDGGATWISTTLRDVPVNTALLVTDTDRLYAGAINTWSDDQIGGVYRSDDEGQTWARSGLTGTAIADMEVDPRFPDQVYAGSQGEGIYKSEDGGASWQQRFPYGWIWDIALDPEDPDIVYAIVDADIYRSIDAGNSWDILYQRRETDGLPFVLHVPWLPPAPVPSLTATVVDSTSVRLSWLNPSDSDFAGTLVRYMTSTFPVRYDEGVVVTDQVGAPGSTGLFTHTGTFSGTTLYYSAFAYDVDGYYAVATQISVTVGSSAMMRPLTQHVFQAQASPQSTLYLGNSRGLYRREFESGLVYLPVVIQGD